MSQLPPELVALLPALKPLLYVLLFGLLGTLLESIGTRFNVPLLVAIGQRIEGAFADLPKAFRGSRLTASESAKKLPSIPPLVALAMAFALGLSLVACGSNAPPPAKTGSDAAQVVKSVRAGAVLAVRVLDAANATWIDSVKTPSQADLDAMRTTTEALARARDLLNKGEDLEAQVRGAGREILRVAQLLESLGVKLPPELAPVLGFLQGYADAGGEQ